MNTIRGLMRDSFDRFGDDLCEELLRYLSIEQCFDYECVSSQFKRCLFRKQTRLDIHYSRVSNDDFTKQLLRNLNENRYHILKLVLQKCVAINDIELNSIANIEEVIDIIIDYCADLTTIRIEDSVYSVSQRVWQLFGKKFAHSLRSISLFNINKEFIQTLFRLTPNLNDCERIDLNDYLSDDKSVTLLPKLKSINGRFDGKTDFKRLADQYADRVEIIKLFHIENNWVVDDNRVIDIFTQLSRFRRLKVLKICRIKCSDETMNKALNLLAKHCLNLRDLCLRGFHNNNETYANYVYRFSRTFDKLERLSIRAENSALTKNMEYLSSCPHLVCLCVERHHNPTVVHFDVTQSLAQTLRSIRFQLKITDIALRDFITKCVNLRRIDLWYPENLSQSTIEAFISRAKSNPKYNYSLNAILLAKDITREEELDLMISHYSTIAKELPNNLELNIRNNLSENSDLIYNSFIGYLKLDHI